MNPFGNIDEPSAPAWYLPTRPSWFRTIAWYARNPLHNFTHYQIGWAGKNFIVASLKPDSDNDGFCDGGGWARCWLLLRSDDWGMPAQERTRPFISYAGWCHFYLGWHPASGKFGFRLTR